MGELKPCPVPWCASENVRVVEAEHASIFYALCDECKARGPVMGSKKTAAKAWNTRPNPMGEEMVKAVSDAIVGELADQFIALDEFSPAISTTRLARKVIALFDLVTATPHAALNAISEGVEK